MKKQVGETDGGVPVFVETGWNDKVIEPFRSSNTTSEPLISKEKISPEEMKSLKEEFNLEKYRKENNIIKYDEPISFAAMLIIWVLFAGIFLTVFGYAIYKVIKG